MHTGSEIAKFSKLPKSLVLNRLCAGWSAERAINETKNTASRKPKLYLFKGQKYTISELTLFCDFTIHVLRHRLDAGWSVEKAVKTPLDKGVLYDYKGIKYTVVELGKLSGLKERALENRTNLIKARLSIGWSVKDAVETPRGKKPTAEKQNHE